MLASILSFALLSGSTIAATTPVHTDGGDGPVCCTLKPFEYNAYSPTSMDCTKEVVEDYVKFTCEFGVVYHGKNGIFFSVEVPTNETGNSSISFIAGCEDAEGKPVLSLPMHCDTGKDAAIHNWDQNVFRGQRCAISPGHGMRVWQFDPKTENRRCGGSK